MNKGIRFYANFLSPAWATQNFNLLFLSGYHFKDYLQNTPFGYVIFCIREKYTKGYNSNAI